MERVALRPLTPCEGLAVSAPRKMDRERFPLPPGQETVQRPRDRELGLATDDRALVAERLRLSGEALALAAGLEDERGEPAPGLRGPLALEHCPVHARKRVLHDRLGLVRIPEERKREPVEASGALPIETLERPVRPWPQRRDGRHAGVDPRRARDLRPD